MSEPIFREKSLEKVKSPDNLNEYIRVSNPSVWLLLTAIVVLLVGFCIWCVGGRLQTVATVSALCRDGSVVCTLSDVDAERVKPGMAVTVGGIKGTVTTLEARGEDQFTCQVELSAPIADGAYEAVIEIENLRPVSFLLN